MSEADFEDDAHRPLVFRRTRLEIRDGKRWRSLDDRREAVPFQVNEGLDSIAVNHADLDAGLIVLPANRSGPPPTSRNACLPGTAPTTPAPAAGPARLERVEHAIVLGVPSLDEQGVPLGSARASVARSSSRRSRSDEAMRILAADHARRPLVAAIALAVGLILVTVGVVWAIAEALL